MVQQLTLKDYLGSEPNVISARNKLNEAKAALDEINRTLSGSSRASQDTRNLLKKDRDSAAEQVNRLDNLVNQAESNAASYFKKNYERVSTTVYQSTVKKLEEAKKKAKTPEVSADIQATIDGLKEAIANPRPYQEPIVEKQIKVDEKGKVVETGSGNQQEQSYEFIQGIQDDILGSGQYIVALGDAGRKTLAKELNKVYGLNLPMDGKYSPDLKAAYAKALQDRLIRSVDFGRDISTAEFLRIAAKEGTYKGKGGGTTTTTDTDVDITRKTVGQVNQDIEEIAVKVLGRSISEEDKAEGWYDNLVNSINKMYEKGTKTVTNSTLRGGDGKIVSGSKKVITPSVAEADIDALIERRLKKNDPESVGRKERIDFVSWMNKALGD
jgi:hypothetical protein